MGILAAVLLTDRKAVFPVALEYLVDEPLVSKIYINVQTEDPDKYQRVVDFLKVSGKPFDIDYWNMQSSWAGKPKYDQDTARFMPIATGRNFALDWAIVQNMMNPVSHLLFVDSDVRPHKGGLQKLLDLNKPLTGGLVPGRGVHSDVKYVFGFKHQDDNVIVCEHGTSGYMLVSNSIFLTQRFRVGQSLVKPADFLCDDPAYSSDALAHGLADYWYIDVRATADHVDDPNHPLTWKEAINDYNNP